MPAASGGGRECLNFRYSYQRTVGRIDDVAKRLKWPNAYDARVGISAATLYGQIKQFFTESAQLLAQTDEVGAARLFKASTHWLRHTHGAHTLAAGTPIEVVQNNLGHASLATCPQK